MSYDPKLQGGVGIPPGYVGYGDVWSSPIGGKPFVVLSVNGGDGGDGGDYGSRTVGTNTGGVAEAISAVSAAGGGTVWVKANASAYQIGAADPGITQPSGVNVIGEQNGGVTFNYTGTGRAWLCSGGSGSPRRTLANVTIVGNANNTTKNAVVGLKLENCYGLSAYDITISACDRELWLDSVSAAGSENNWFQNLTLNHSVATGNNNQAILWGSSTGNSAPAYNRVRNVNVIGNALKCQTALYITSSTQGDEFSGLEIGSCVSAIYLNPVTAGNGVGGIKIQGAMESITGTGFYVAALGSGVSGEVDLTYNVGDTPTPVGSATAALLNNVTITLFEVSGGTLKTWPSVGLGFAVATPAVPASTIDQTNSNSYDVRVYVTGTGTGITAVGITDPSGTLVSIVATVSAGQYFDLEPGAKIRLTYTGAPTWKWYGLRRGRV